ncbi:MAG TPA: glycosyltransferase [Candidatus Polarisedimenticolia bacterium]|nr:glycosyltransferase [Candidatus Polarisedimenticolia bacterium]
MTARGLAALLFWIGAAVLVYVHLLVPVLLRALASFTRRTSVPEGPLPGVTVVIAARNEEKHLRAKIENTLALDYPPEILEILVISDASTDGTAEVVRSFTDPRVRLHEMAERGGKAQAQNVSAGLARHDVLFFTDATTMHPPEALRSLVRGLGDPSVGCVTGRVVFRKDEGAVSRGLENRFAFEMGSRSALGDVYSLLGAQDCVYAVPRARYVPVRPDLDGGFVGPILILERGLRTAYEPEALALVDRPPPSLRSEFDRRSRIVLRGLRGTLSVARLLNPFVHPRLAWALWSTRLLRWLTPVFMLATLLANLALLDSPLYRGTLLLQGLFYLLAAIGWLRARAGRGAPPFIALPFYFCLLAAAAAVGIARLLRGETGQVWTTVR